MFWNRLSRTIAESSGILQDADSAKDDARESARRDSCRLDELEVAHERLRKSASPMLDTMVRQEGR